jgi:alpha-tubulin suppressor-like RCC1 family protein
VSVASAGLIGFTSPRAQAQVAAFSQISAGRNLTCGITLGGAAKCWGAPTGLGNGTNTSSSVPVPVTGLSSGVTSISAGSGFACAVVAGAAKCWGSNVFGQLGNGTNTNSNVPVSVTGLSSGVTMISVGDIHTCALQGGVGKCWGHNGFGQLGVGSFTHSNVPVTVSGPVSLMAISAGGSHSCATLSGGAGVECWGSNQFGQLGNGTNTISTTPVNVSSVLTAGSATVTSLSAGLSHTCASVTLTFNGILNNFGKCWGANQAGQLGNGATTNSNIPTTYGGISSVATAAAGGDFSCVNLKAVGVNCRGSNALGQLGEGSTPGGVSGLGATISSVSAGFSHACAIMNGVGKCWGSNAFGQLGNGTTANSNVPVNVVP